MTARPEIHSTDRLHATWQRSSRLTTVVALLIAGMLLSGCAWLRGREPELNIDLRGYLPREWTPIDNWQPINIDDDDTVERLLFYRYENGQVGGVIYDPQTDADFAPVDTETQVFALPSQGGTVIMVPYRLLPSFWQGRGQGFLADPGVTPTIIQARRPDNERGDQSGQAENERKDELIVRGGNTHISIFWWQDRIRGYGVTHLYAPGGFYDLDWSGRTEETTLLSMDGYFPEMDRNYFCRRVTYSRAIDNGSQIAGGRMLYLPTIGYLAEPRGLAFCKTADAPTRTYPEYTFYPEATVLSYLLHPRGERQNVNNMVNLVNLPLKPGESPVQDPGKLPERERLVRSVDSVTGEFKRVHSLTYYPTLEIVSSAQALGSEVLAMQVVAELVEDLPEGASPSLDPILFDRGERIRTVTFVLQYQAPVLNPENTADRRTDRWLIVNAIAAD